VDALLSSLSHGMTLIQGPPSTGKSLLSAQIAQSLYHNNKSQRTVMIFKTERNLVRCLHLLLELGIPEHHLVVYGHGEDTPWSPEARSWGIHGRTDVCLRKRSQLLGEVDRLVSSLGILGAYGRSCEQAGFFFKEHIQSRWRLYTEQALETNAEQAVAQFPFTLFFGTAPQPLFPLNATLDQIKDIAEGCYRHLCRLFDDLQELQPLEVFRETEERAFYHLIGISRLVLMTSAQMFCGKKELIARRFRYDQLIMDEAHKFSEFESFFAMSLQRPKTENHPLKRVILLGDPEGLKARLKRTPLIHASQMHQSFFERMLRLEVPSITLKQVPVPSPAMPLWTWKYPELVADTESIIIPGLGYEYQFVHVSGQEHELLPGNYQNVEEAEWLIAMYLYLIRFG
jgi:intron-binding protein aquarius